MMLQKIYDRQGMVKAALAVELSLAQFDETVHEISIGDSSYAWLTDTSGLVFASVKPEMVMREHKGVSHCFVCTFSLAGGEDIDDTFLWQFLSIRVNPAKDERFYAIDETKRGYRVREITDLSEVEGLPARSEKKQQYARNRRVKQKGFIPSASLATQ
jgi:hypothetical protein